MPFTTAQRRYNKRVILLGAVYLVTLLVAVYLLEHHLVSGTAAYLAGLLPALAVSSFFWLMARYLVEEGDEYQRMLQIRQLLIATAIALTAAMIWGFLEAFGLAPHIVAYAWPITWFAGLWVGAGINFLIERSGA